MPTYDGLIFDMDGTLTVPALDFQRIRAEIGLPPGDLAVAIAALPEAGRRRAWGIIERHEREANRHQRLQEGCRELLARCRRETLKVGVVTRNMSESVDVLCRRFDLTFDIALAREFQHMKPHPGPVLHILDVWGFSARQVLMIGDYVHDIQCGQAASVATCFFENPGKPCRDAVPDYSVKSMAELERLVFGGEGVDTPCAG
jgi:HAD superfamily hydrolase (TIGR01549 family)